MTRELRWVIEIQDMIANASGFEVNRHMFHLTQVGSGQSIVATLTDRTLEPEILQVISRARANAGSDSA